MKSYYVTDPGSFSKIKNGSSFVRKYITIFTFGSYHCYRVTDNIDETIASGRADAGTVGARGSTRVYGGHDDIQSVSGSVGQ